MDIKFVDKIGKKRVRYEKATNAKGKTYNKPITEDAPYRTLEVKNCKSPEDFARSVPDILAAKVPGFMDWPMLFDHIAYGLMRHVAVMLNVGQDVRLTDNQRDTLKTFVILVQLGKDVPGGMTREKAIEFLTVQGFEDAEKTFDAAYSDPVDEPNDDDDDDDTSA